MNFSLQNENHPNQKHCCNLADFDGIVQDMGNVNNSIKADSEDTVEGLKTSFYDVYIRVLMKISLSVPCTEKRKADTKNIE